MKKSILLIYILVISLVTYSQGFDKEKMDSLFYKIEKYDKGMGCISILKNGNEVTINPMATKILKKKFTLLK